MKTEIYVLPVKCSHGVRLTIMDHNLLLYITSVWQGNAMQFCIILVQRLKAA